MQSQILAKIFSILMILPILLFFDNRVFLVGFLCNLDTVHKPYIALSTLCDLDVPFEKGDVELVRRLKKLIQMVEFYA